MTITTAATTYQGKETLQSIKLPGKELQLLIQNAAGTTLGNVTLSRVESSDVTALELAIKSGRRQLKNVMELTGLTDPLFTLDRKNAGKLFTREHADFTIAAAGEAAYFLDQANQRRYHDLHVMLKPTPVK